MFKTLAQARTRRAMLLGVILAAGTSNAWVAAQCPSDWIKTDGFPGIETFQNAIALTSWDSDGEGPEAPRLVVSGTFQYIDNRVVDHLASLNPETGQWEDLAGGIDLETKFKEEILDEGTVYSLSTFEDDLIAAGGFEDAGDVPVNNIARWDGTSWSPLGAGLNGLTSSMTVYNGELIAAGNFIETGDGTTVNFIARWNGTSWLPLGPAGGPAGMDDVVQSVAVYNGELIAVGHFTTAGGVPADRIARWNGSQWQSLGTGLNAAGFGLAVLGNDLYVGGEFTLAGGVPDTRGVARWDGANWHPVGGGLFNGVSALVAYHGDVIAGGPFIVTLNGQQSRHIARFDTATQSWVAMDGGFNAGGDPSDLVVHNDEVVAAGAIRRAGSRTASGIARWSDVTESWDRFGSGFNITPFRFTTYRGDLIAAGTLDSAGDIEANGVARLDGAVWHPLGTGIDSVSQVIEALEVYDDDLIVAGIFHSAGGLATENIAAWNGDTETWHALGSGITGGVNPRVLALAVYNGELIAGGQFTTADGVPCANIARWDGAAWHPLGVGVGGNVNALAVYNGELIAVGSFFSAGGNPEASGLARWDGSNWHAFPPGGQNGFALTVYDGKLITGALAPHAWDGTTWTTLPGYSFDPNGNGAFIYAFAVLNNELIVGGEFENAAGIPEADGLVRFNGTSWNSMATANGTTASITSSAWVHNGELITNGRLEHPDGTISNWRRLGPVCSPGDVTGDGVVDVDDLIAVILSWGSCPASSEECPADVNDTGEVDVDDLIIVILNWG